MSAVLNIGDTIYGNGMSYGLGRNPLQEMFHLVKYLGKLYTFNNLQSKHFWFGITITAI